jgi:hypothetical protein
VRAATSPIARLLASRDDGELDAGEDLLVEHALEQRVARLELEVAELRPRRQRR